MTAITLGNTAPNPLARLPHIPLAPATPKASKPDQLYYKSTDSGLIVYVGKKPVAWLYPGHHQGIVEGQKRTVRFIDVAYHRQTQHGVNLETAFYDTLQEAVDFITATFGKGGAA